MTYIAQFYPDALDVNGDAQNARVLQERARWAGADVPIRPISAPPSADDPETPTAVVIGSGVDADLPHLADAVAAWSDVLRRWFDEGVPMLAVGMGYELLTDSIVISDEKTVAGAGVISGRARPASGRVSGDLVVESSLGTFVGYENHARVVERAGADRFGRVVHGHSDGDGHDGVRRRNLIASRMHGPILAKNPVLADHFLTLMIGAVPESDHPLRRQADAAAARARRTIAQSCGVRLD